MAKNRLQKIFRAGQPVSTSKRIFDAVERHIHDAQLVNPTHTKLMLGFEELGSDDRLTLNSAADNLSVAIETIGKELMFEGVSEAQIAAAEAGALLAADWRAAVAFKPKQMSAISIGVEGLYDQTETGWVNDSVETRDIVGLESYDETENRKAVIYTVTYNYQAARQDEFGEALAPTVCIDSQNSGIGIQVDLMMIYENVQHKISGDVSDFYMKNIIRAVANPDLLKKQVTRVRPVYRPQSAHNFSSVIAAKNLIIEGVTIPTAPLAVGKKASLIALAQHDDLIKLGVFDQTDALDTALWVEKIYLVVGEDVIAVNTANIPYNNFAPSPQNNSRLQTLNMTTTSVVINKETVSLTNGGALKTLKPIVDLDLVMRLEIQMSGTINTQTGDYLIQPGYVGVFSISDGTNLLDPKAAPAAAIVQAVSADTTKIDSLDIYANFTNSNKRQRGQFLDRQFYTQLYQVPYLSPITTLRPNNSDGVTDASDVQSLVTATRVRIQNDIVTFLHSVRDTLKEYCDARDVNDVGPDVLGCGRFYVRATYDERPIDLTTVIQGLRSNEVGDQISAALVNMVRDIAYNMYRNSEYQPAADQLTGGTAPVPTVVIATDPYIARYLMIPGELRLGGPEFQVKLVSSWNKYMRGKIAIVFTVMDENRNTAINPLNFANLLWAPESVLAANISRGNTTSKETTAMPRYLFINNCPIMGWMNVTGIPESATARMPYDVRTFAQTPAPAPAP